MKQSWVDFNRLPISDEYRKPCFYVKARIALHIQTRIIYDELYSVYDDEASSLRTAQRGPQWFREGREEVEDEPRSDGSAIETTSENIKQVRLIVDDGPHTTIEEIQEQIGLSYGTTHQILSDGLNLRKITARYIPKHLTDFQRPGRVRICKQNRAEFEQGP